MGLEAILTGLSSAMGIYSGIKSMSTPSADAAKIAAPPSTVNTTAGGDALSAARMAKQKQALAAGFQSTISTSPTGDTTAATIGKKSLLGS